MHLDLIRDVATQFPPVDEPDGVRTARVWHCSFRSLAPLSRFTNLHTLVIASYPDESLRVLAPLTNLKHLAIVHLPRVGDLAPLLNLSSLEILSLATLPSWDSSDRVQVVSSIATLAALPQLRHLELFGVVPPDRSLVPLHSCKYLSSARFSKFPKAEIEGFREATGVGDAHNPEPVFSAA